MGFFKSLISELKSDLKSEVRSEAKSLTREAIKDVKEALKPKDKQQQIVKEDTKPTPQVNLDELSGDDKVFGKSIDEYREIFQDLSNRHCNDLAGIYADPVYQNLDAETKEYINRVYMPALEESIKTGVEAHQELNSKMEDKVNNAQAMYDEAKKDGVVSAEEEIALNKEAMKVFGETFNAVGEMAPKYLEKAGNIAQDLSARVENEDVADALNGLGDKFKDDNYQNQTKDSLVGVSNSYSRLADVSDKMIDSSGIVDDAVRTTQTQMNEMQKNLEQAADAVDMSKQDIKNAFDQGANMSSEQVNSNAVNEMKNLKNIASSGASEEEIKDATKKMLNASLNTFGNLFKGDEQKKDTYTVSFYSLKSFTISSFKSLLSQKFLICILCTLAMMFDGNFLTIV